MITHHVLTALAVPGPPDGFLPFGFRVEPVFRPNERDRGAAERPGGSRKDSHHLFHALPDALRYVAEEGTCRTRLVALAVSGEARVQSEWDSQTGGWGEWLPD